MAKRGKVKSKRRKVKAKAKRTSTRRVVRRPKPAQRTLRPCKHGPRVDGKCPSGPGGKRAPKPSTIGKLLSTTKLKQERCARNSLRAIQPNGRPDVRIIVCCPPEQWNADTKRCAVPLKPHAKKKYEVGLLQSLLG